jgi:hypothetical protein
MALFVCWGCRCWGCRCWGCRCWVAGVAALSRASGCPSLAALGGDDLLMHAVGVVVAQVADQLVALRDQPQRDPTCRARADTLALSRTTAGQMPHPGKPARSHGHRHARQPGNARLARAAANARAPRPVVVVRIRLVQAVAPGAHQSPKSRHPTPIDPLASGSESSAASDSSRQPRRARPHDQPAGRRSTNTDPRPAPALEAVICPPCASTTALAMARPMPDPPCARSRAKSAR